MNDSPSVRQIERGSETRQAQLDVPDRQIQVPLEGR